MRAKNILYSLAAGFVAISISIAPAYAKDNFFKRSANAVKKFFSDDKRRTTALPTRKRKKKKPIPKRAAQQQQQQQQQHSLKAEKSTTNRSLSSTTCRLRKTRLFRNWATNALKYANTSRYRQKTIVVRAKHRDDTQRRGNYSHCRRQRPVSAKRHHTAPNGGKSAAPIYGIP